MELKQGPYSQEYVIPVPRRRRPSEFKAVRRT